MEYVDVDYKNKTVSVNKMCVDGAVCTPRKKYKLRTLPLPDTIYSRMSKNKKGRIFKKVGIERYEELLNTHVYLLLKKNVSLNIIYRNLGMQSYNDFETRFNFLLPQKLDENFQIL